MQEGGAHLADRGQFGEQHLKDGGGQRLLEDLQQLLRLTAHGNGIRQVVDAFLKFTWVKSKSEKIIMTHARNPHAKHKKLSEALDLKKQITIKTFGRPVLPLGEMLQISKTLGS